MAEQFNLPNGTFRKSELTFEQIQERLRLKQEAANRIPTVPPVPSPDFMQHHPGYAPQPQAPQQQPMPRPRVTTIPPTAPEARPGAYNPNIITTPVAPEAPKKPNFLKTKIGKIAVGIVLTAGLISGAGLYAYNENVAGAKDFADGLFNSSTEAAGPDYEVMPLEMLGTESLAPGQCDQPEAVLAVATVTGSLPLVPLIATTENPTPARAKQYMNEEYMEDLDKDEQKIFENYITDSEYNNATLNEFPLALKVCEPLGANAVTEKDGELIINRSALKVKFEDLNSLFNRPIVRAVYQIEGAEVKDLNKADGHFMTLPDPARNFFIEAGEDEVYNKSITELQASMVTDAQWAAILAAMETSAVEQLANVVDGHDNIVYPKGAKSLQQAIDKALVKRLIGDQSNAKLSFTGNYSTEMVTVNDPATKAPYVLKNLDPTEKFRISNITLEFGSLPEPAIIEPKPEPTPAPTEAPAEAATNETEG